MDDQEIVKSGTETQRPYSNNRTFRCTTATRIQSCDLLIRRPALSWQMLQPQGAD